MTSSSCRILSVDVVILQDSVCWVKLSCLSISHIPFAILLQSHDLILVCWLRPSCFLIVQSSPAAGLCSVGHESLCGDQVLGYENLWGHYLLGYESLSGLLVWPSTEWSISIRHMLLSLFCLQTLFLLGPHDPAFLSKEIRAYLQCAASHCRTDVHKCVQN